MPAARLRGLLLFVCSVCAVDWTVKLCRPWLWDGWVPHVAHRSPANLLWVAACAILIVWAFDSRLAIAGAGIAAGGLTANVLDVNVDGVAWNMIPLPGTPGEIWCNVADLAIIAGAAVLLIAVVRELRRELAARPAAS